MRSLRRFALRLGPPLLVLGIALGLQGCRTQEDAVAASEQMAAAASAMRQYYITLAVLVDRTVEVRRAQRALLQGPPDPASDDRLAVRHAELVKREALAEDVARLALIFGEITNSGAASDAAKAAEALRQDAVGLKLLANNAVTQTALQVAVTSLVNVVRVRDERRAAQSLEPVVVALCAFFDSEKPAYLAVAADYFAGAAANAQVLIERDQVSVASQYRSSLEPFGLTADLTSPELKAAARAELQAAVSQRLIERNRESASAADALSDALHRMQGRVDTVATGRVMRVRVPPLELDAVRAWIAELQTLAGVNL